MVTVEPVCCSPRCRVSRAISLILTKKVIRLPLLSKDYEIMVKAVSLFWENSFTPESRTSIYPETMRDIHYSAHICLKIILPPFVVSHPWISWATSVSWSLHPWAISTGSPIQELPLTQSLLNELLSNSHQHAEIKLEKWAARTDSKVQSGHGSHAISCHPKTVMVWK